MTRRRPVRADEPLRWLAANGADLAPLTGTDTKALLAIAAAWELFAYTRHPAVLRAIRELLGQMQRHTAPLARDLIARSMDWSDRDRWWPMVWTDEPAARPSEVAALAARLGVRT